MLTGCWVERGPSVIASVVAVSDDEADWQALVVVGVRCVSGIKRRRDKADEKEILDANDMVKKGTDENAEKQKPTSFVDFVADDAQSNLSRRRTLDQRFKQRALDHL